MKEKINTMNPPTWSWLRVNGNEVTLFDGKKRGTVQAEIESVLPLLELTKEGIEKTEALFENIENGVPQKWINTLLENRNSGYLLEGSQSDTNSFCHISYRALGENIADYHVLHAKEGETLNVIIRYVEGQEQDSLTRIIAEKNANIQLIKVHEAKNAEQVVDVVAAKVASGAEVRVISVDLAGARLLTNYTMDLVEDEAKGEIETIYLADGTQEYDFLYQMNHMGKRSESDILLNGVMEDAARKTFRGTLNFHPGCRGAKGNELENVALLSPEVRSKAVPILLCGEDDVEGNHAVSAGRLDEEALFYITSRGISPEDARRMLVYAKLAPTLDKIPVTAVKHRVLERIGIDIAEEVGEI